VKLDNLPAEFRGRYASQLTVAERSLATGRWDERDALAVLGTLAALQGDLEQASTLYALAETVHCPHCQGEMAIPYVVRR
jgi:hypothetical protein